MNYQELLQSPLLSPHTIPLVQRAARSNVPVFILGEQGLEKEAVAKAIHYSGDWKYYRFYKMDCKIRSEDSFNDQLIRIYNENSFGTIPATLYLKEIGNMGSSAQSKLLDLMEDGFLMNNGEKKAISHLRFIASSSEDIKEKVAQNKFSEDLYHRLNTLSINIPPLRKRAQDISAIAQYILEEQSKKMRTPKAGFSKAALTMLKNYWWPGNLRELEQVITRGVLFSKGEMLLEHDLILESEHGNSQSLGTPEDIVLKQQESRSQTFPPELNGNALSLFLIELVHRLKNPLVSIKTFTQLLREKFGEEEFRDQYYRIVTEDIGKIDSLLNVLLSYIKINTPIEKRNTVHAVLEDVLKKNESQLEYKKIKIFKKYEEDLPEAVVHEEQLRYILDALLQYAIPSIPPDGSIGFLTKSLDPEKHVAEENTSHKKNGRYIEISIIFTGYKKPIEQFRNVLGITPRDQKEAVEIELRLVKEIIEKNQGLIQFEFNEKKPRTYISLRFPVERRKLIYYQPVNV